MSVNEHTLEFLTDEELIDKAQGQAALTMALAERLEMVAREKVESNLNQLEFAND